MPSALETIREQDFREKLAEEQIANATRKLDLEKKRLRAEAGFAKAQVEHQKALTDRARHVDQILQQIAAENEVARGGGGFGLVTSPGEQPLVLMGDDIFGGKRGLPLTAIDEPASMETLGDRGPVDRLAKFVEMARASAPPGSPGALFGDSANLYPEDVPPRPTHDNLWQLMREARPEISEYYGEPVRREAEDRLAGLMTQVEQTGAFGDQRYLPSSVVKTREDIRTAGAKERAGFQDELIRGRMRDRDDRHEQIWNARFQAQAALGWGKVATDYKMRHLLDEWESAARGASDISLSKNENKLYADRRDELERQIGDEIESIQTRAIAPTPTTVQSPAGSTAQSRRQRDRKRLFDAMTRAKRVGNITEWRRLWNEASTKQYVEE